MNKKLLPITFSILFIVSCGGGGGGGGSTPTPSTTPAPTVNLSAEPTSVFLGSTSTPTWSSTNATSCSASWTTQTVTFDAGSTQSCVTLTGVADSLFSERDEVLNFTMTNFSRGLVPGRQGSVSIILKEN